MIESYRTRDLMKSLADNTSNSEQNSQHAVPVCDAIHQTEQLLTREEFDGYE